MTTDYETANRHSKRTTALIDIVSKIPGASISGEKGDDRARIYAHTDDGRAISGDIETFDGETFDVKVRGIPASLMGDFVEVIKKAAIDYVSIWELPTLTRSKIKSTT